MGDNKTQVFHSSKHVCLTHVHLKCLTTGGQEVHRQETHQNVHLPLIGPDGKYNELRVFLLKPLSYLILGYFPEA